MSIIEALNAVMADVQAVGKNDRNKHANYNFRGIDAVVNAVGPALRKHGVVVVPNVDAVEYADVQTSTGKPANACRVRVTYTFHAGESHINSSVVAEAWDHGDKAAPKAMSVAFRTALLQALALPTDEPDPDSHTYERAAPEPVDLAPLEAAIINAQDAGVEKPPEKWQELRDFASKSPEHLSKALGRIFEAMADAEGVTA